MDIHIEFGPAFQELLDTIKEMKADLAKIKAATQSSEAMMRAGSGAAAEAKPLEVEHHE